MSDPPIHPAPGGDGPFGVRATLAIVAVGILGFIAMLVLGAYAPDLRSGRNGGAHALSNSSTGFSGLVRLASETGRNPSIVRFESELGSEDLTIVTPDHGWTDLSKIIERRGPKATLLVLPKWETEADEEASGWVRVSGLLPANDPARILYPDQAIRISRARSEGEPLANVGLASTGNLHFVAPRVLQTMSGKGLEPMIVDQEGRIVLARDRGRPLYLLSEPDLLNNHGMGDEGQARSALALLDFLNSNGADGIKFDVTTNGLGRSLSPLKLAFDAPFLAVTLTIFAAMLLAGWQALVRFGPVRRRERAIAFGKAALVDNSAALIRKAGREGHLGARYCEVIRELAMNLFRLPSTLDQRALEERLETVNPNRSFASAARAAERVRTRDELLNAARSLNHWLKESQ
jgi:hypothetical protein